MTITYYQRDVNRATGTHVGDHEDALELDSGDAVSESISLAALASGNFVFTSPPDDPGSADWPNGTYRCQLDCTAAGADISYGLRNNTATGHFMRVNSALTADLEGIAQAEALFTGTGLKLATASWNPAAGATTDRFECLVAVRNTNSSMTQSITLQLNTVNSFADGPWTAPAPADIHFDAKTENIAAADPQVFPHTPLRSAEGVLVLIAHGTTSSDIVAGPVTYGGVNMTRVRTDADTTGEPGRSYIYFLGSGVPTGAQNVSIDRTEATTTVWVCAVSLRSDGTLEAIDSDGLSVDQANPQVTLQFGGRNALSFCVLYSGLAAPSSVASLSDQVRLHDHDFGAFVAVADRLLEAQTADDTIGYTAASDDVAFTAVAIAKVVAASAGPQPARVLSQAAQTAGNL